MATGAGPDIKSPPKRSISAAAGLAATDALLDDVLPLVAPFLLMLTLSFPTPEDSLDEVFFSDVFEDREKVDRGASSSSSRSYALPLPEEASGSSP